MTQPDERSQHTIITAQDRRLPMDVYWQQRDNFEVDITIHEAFMIASTRYPIDAEIDTWIASHSPQPVIKSRVLWLLANEKHTRVTHTNQSIQVGDRRFGFRFVQYQFSREQGDYISNNFYLDPPFPESTLYWIVSDVVLKDDICRALGDWQGVPIETLPNPRVFFSKTEYRDYREHSRVKVGDANYYFRAITAGNAEGRVFTVLTVLDQRDPVLEQALVRALEPHFLKGEYNEINLHLRTGEKITHRL